MLRHFFKTFSFLFLPFLSCAQSFSDGLQFGVNLDPGLMYDPGIYFPYAEFTATCGIKAGYTFPGGNISAFTGLLYAHYNYKVDRDYGGTQVLDFVEVPVGVRVLGGASSKVKMYFEPALSICFLADAKFLGVYKDGAYQYSPGNNKADCNQTVLRPSVGWGFHFNVGEHCAINLGWKVATNINDIYRDFLKHPVGVHLSAMSLQLGFEYHLGSIHERSTSRNKHRKKTNSESSRSYYDVNG